MPEFDKIIRNGTIIDGTGAIPAFHGDVAIKNGKIATISGHIRGSAPEEFDATGCIVDPEAVDQHNESVEKPSRRKFFSRKTRRIIGGLVVASHGETLTSHTPRF